MCERFVRTQIPTRSPQKMSRLCFHDPELAKLLPACGRPKPDAAYDEDDDYESIEDEDEEEPGSERSADTGLVESPKRRAQLPLFITLS